MLSRRPIGVAPKLTVSHPGDRSELEADQAAAQIMRMPASAQVQRKCPDDECNLHRSASDAAPASFDAGAIHGAMEASSASTLDSAQRSFFEPRFGSDFGQVRVHNDQLAEAASAHVNARAFTYGNHIFFGRGEYRPTSAEGGHLLAHELAHVVQQGGGAGQLQRQIGSRSGGGRSGGGEGMPPPSRTLPGRDGSGGSSADGGASRGGSRGGGAAEAGGRAVKAGAAGAALPCVVQSGAGHPVGSNLTFGRDSSALSASDLAEAERFAKSWKASGGSSHVEVHGYASIEGAASYNLGLSCRRALATRKELSRLGIPTSLITPVAHGETIEFDAKTLPPNRRVIISLPGSRIVRPPRQPTQRGVCGGINAFFREILLIDPSLANDIVTCLCFAASIADAIPIPVIGQNPAVELTDCGCNIFVFLQEVYKRGNKNGCWSPANMSASDAIALGVLATVDTIDCFSVPIGDTLGAFILGLFGTAAEPGGGTAAGAGAGALLGDFIVDLATMAIQNYITQGTVLPADQWNACGRLFQKLGKRGRRTPPRNLPGRPGPRQTGGGQKGGGPGGRNEGQQQPTPPGKQPTPTGRRLVCGPNVTPQVINAIDLAKSTFRGWNAGQKRAACDALDTLPIAAFAWDIFPLHVNQWILRYRCPGGKAPCPSYPSPGANPSPGADPGICATAGGHCGSTVEVMGQCFYAGSVNYVIFGHMARMCGMPEVEMSLLIQAYKLRGEAGGNFDTAKAWAEAGYAGWHGGGTPSPDRSDCEPTCPTPYAGWSERGTNAVAGRDFDLIWCPNTPRQWKECTDEMAAWESIIDAALKGIF